jgi:hypothetical protein
MIDSGEKEFKTFLFIEKDNNKYICRPAAAEVYPQSNTIIPNRLKMSIEEAYNMHKQWKKHIEDTVSMANENSPSLAFENSPPCGLKSYCFFSLETKPALSFSLSL